MTTGQAAAKGGEERYGNSRRKQPGDAPALKTAPTEGPEAACWSVPGLGDETKQGTAA